MYLSSDKISKFWHRAYKSGDPRMFKRYINYIRSAIKKDNPKTKGASPAKWNKALRKIIRTCK